MARGGSQNSEFPSQLIDAKIKDLGDWRGETPRKGPNSYQAGLSRCGRGVEMERRSGVGARRHHLHRRNLQGRRETDLCQGRLAG